MVGVIFLRFPGIPVRRRADFARHQREKRFSVAHRNAKTRNHTGGNYYFLTVTRLLVRTS